MRRYKKPHRVKRKKSIFRNRFFWLGILTTLILFSIFYFLFFSKTFQVEKIIITGEDKVSTAELKALVGKKLENKILFFKTKSIFSVNLDEIRKDILNNFPQIAEVEIDLGLPDALNIAVIERIALAVWCEGNSCFLIDNEGVIFEEAPLDTDLIKITGEEAIEKGALAQIFEIQSKLQETLKISITEASIVSDERLNIKTSEGWEIYFNLKGDINWQITELGLVLEKQIPPECGLARKRGELEYVDLRFSRVYCK